MKSKTKMVLAAALVAGVVGGVALATPTVGAFYNVVVSSGVIDRDVHVRASVSLPGQGEDFGAEVHTYGAANFIVQDIKISPGGYTGWHTHPGILLLTLAPDSGPVDWYDAHCGKVTYQAGDAWTESTKLHDVVNNSSTDAHFLVTYIVAKDIPKRTDEKAPRCASALGLH
jgi:quercetin dioxygenase-like cupin family protein